MWAIVAEHRNQQAALSAPDALLQVEALPEQHCRLMPELLQFLLQLQVIPAGTAHGSQFQFPEDRPRVCPLEKLHAEVPGFQQKR